MECWRGGRKGLFQRWYEIRFVAAQVTEMAKQLSTKGDGAAADVVVGVLEAAAAMDSEREELKMTLNKYYHFLKRSRGKVSKPEEDGINGTGEADEDAS
jgi:hypothetical protein